MSSKTTSKPTIALPCAAPTRRRFLGSVAAALAVGGCASRPAPAPRAGIVPFSLSPASGGLPQGWVDHVMRRDLPATHYSAVDVSGKTVTHAVAQRATSGLRCDVDIDPAATPWLGWDWRVDEVPADATVADDDMDDAPARVVLAFDGSEDRLSLRELMFREQVQLFTGHTLPYATLMYVWDGRAAPESVFQYRRSGRIRYLVVESGTRNAGRWQRYRRNVVDDYWRVFGEAPGRIVSVGVMTDSDDLRIRAEAWFGDLTLGTS